MSTRLSKGGKRLRVLQPRKSGTKPSTSEMSTTTLRSKRTASLRNLKARLDRDSHYRKILLQPSALMLSSIISHWAHPSRLQSLDAKMLKSLLACGRYVVAQHTAGKRLAKSFGGTMREEWRKLCSIRSTAT